MKVPTKDLIGGSLEWAMDMARTGRANMILPAYHWLHETGKGPTKNWGLGGPVIELEGLELIPWFKQADDNLRWEARYSAEPELIIQFGPTPLIAACRCFVAIRLGEEIEVPEDLLPK